MIRVEFSPQTIENLDYERYHHPSPRVQRKMEILYRKSTGMSRKEICKICRVSKAYLKRYRDGGLEGLKALHYKGRANALLDHRPTLEAHFKTHPPRTTAEARAVIENLTGIRRSPTQVREFMKRIGMK